MEAKERDDGKLANLLTLEAFEEMLDFHDFIYTISFPAPKPLTSYTGDVEEGTMITYADICERRNITDERVEKIAESACKEYGEKYCIVDAPMTCKTSSKPIDFIYERKNNEFNLNRYTSDNDLIAKVQTGKGDEFAFYGAYNNIFVDYTFGGTIPKNPE